MPMKALSSIPSIALATAMNAYIPNKEWWNWVLLKSGDPTPVAVVMTPLLVDPLWRYSVQHQGSSVEAVVGELEWIVCICEKSGGRVCDVWWAEGNSMWGAEEVRVCVHESIINVNAHHLVVLPYHVLTAHHHGYLDHLLRVLKDKVNVVTSKVLLLTDINGIPYSWKLLRGF